MCHGYDISNVKLSTLVEGDPRAPFSIATTLMCRGWCYFFPWIAPLYPWCVPYIAECYATYQVYLKSLVWHDLGLNPDLPDHWRTLYPQGQWNHCNREVKVILELWGMHNTSSLPLLPGPLCPGVVALYSFLSIGQIEITCRLMLALIFGNRIFIFNCL